MARFAARSLVALGFALAAFAVPSAARAEDAREGEMDLVIAEEQKVDDLLRAFTKLTKVQVSWASDDRAITNKKIVGARVIHGTARQLFHALRGILSSQEVVLVPMGEKPNEYFMAMDARAIQSQFILRMKALPVDLTDENLADYEKQDGLFVSTTIPVKNLDNLRDARTALQRMITQNNIGNVQEVPAARAFVVTDFAPNVVAIYRAIRRMDTVPAARATRTEFFALKHANAKNVARVLEELFSDSKKPLTPMQQNSGELPAPDVRIAADTDSGQVVVIATEDKIAAMRPVVERLDRQPSSTDCPPVR